MEKSIGGKEFPKRGNRICGYGWTRCKRMKGLNRESGELTEGEVRERAQGRKTKTKDHLGVFWKPTAVEAALNEYTYERNIITNNSETNSQIDISCHQIKPPGLGIGYI